MQNFELLDALVVMYVLVSLHQCVGIDGEVLGVNPIGNVIVKFKSLKKKWIVNPEVLTSRVMSATFARVLSKKT